MNKKLYFSICLTVLCVFFAISCVILIFTVNDLNRNNTKRSAVEPENLSSDSNPISYYLVIGEGDEVNLYSVYENGDKKAEGHLSGINMMTMRKADKRSFEKGIILKSREEVLHLIEDYSS